MTRNEIIFYVQGSAMEPYKVTFEKSGNNINAYCTCQAGDNGQYCKHRFSILAGDGSAVISDNVVMVGIVKSWLPGSDLETALNELAEAEHLFDKAKSNVATAKKNVARAMRR